MGAPSSSHSPFSGTGSTSRKSAATTAPAGLDVRAFAADRFSACACGWPCLGSCNGSLWHRSSLFGVRLLSPLFFRPRNGCFLLPSVAFALRRRREAVACAGHRRSWPMWSEGGAGKFVGGSFYGREEFRGVEEHVV